MNNASIRQLDLEVRWMTRGRLSLEPEYQSLSAHILIRAYDDSIAPEQRIL